MKTFVLSLMCGASVIAITGCSSDGERSGQATVCSTSRFRESWGTFAQCCEDIGEDGHLYVYGKVDPTGEQGGVLVIRRYLDRSGPPCRTGDGATDCGCGSGASVACEEDDAACEYGQTGSAMPDFHGDESSVVFFPEGESDRCGADDNGAAPGGTHPAPASSEEYTGRQRGYSPVAGTVPGAYTACMNGVPGVILTLQASCTGEVTGTVSWGEHAITCTSGAGGNNLVEKSFWTQLDGSVEVEHSPTGWQGWAESCEGNGPCELRIDGDTTVQGQFGS